MLTDYQQRTDSTQQEIDKYEKLINKYSLLRLVIFALVVVAIYLSVKTIGIGLLIVLFVILMLGFTWLVSKQSFFIGRRDYFKALKKVTENEIGSITNRSNIYDNGSGFADDKHGYTADLDIFGKATLFQMINRAATGLGKSLLADWLSAPAQKDVVLNRQESLKELSTKNSWKLDFQAKLLFANGTNASQLNNLFTYLRMPLELPGEKALSAYIKIAPYLLLAAIVAAVFYPIVSLAAIAIAIVNFGILTAKGSYILKSAAIADKIGQTLGNYTTVFQAIEKEEWSSPGCSKMAQHLKTEGTAQKIEQLSRLINKLGYSSIMIVGFILNVFSLWALKQIIAIENWKRNNQQSLETAFDVIAEFEALNSIASLHINYPEWSFPQIIDGENYTVTAKGLAHPLINIKNRVANDYELNNTYKIDIITGSNMAGKSTFLRTIGINSVLALCGAPVCAEEMQVSVIIIKTYMRIKDSLNESTSTFKAELDRLQMLLTAVENEPKVFFLIDEMLRGTNSVDKYLGSKAVIEQLIKKKGVGIVATHDLQIAELEKDHPDYVRNFYFDIQVKDGEMLFDYKIKHGECKTFNASLLLKQIGIDVGA
ncbi:MAG: DNA mismatch repair protein MutS [Bacteroidota bacterium]|nr:DNA mismatch repair protein MutS [Bacteroidota bacterium]